MPDDSNQLGKNLRKNKEDAERALKRGSAINPQLERVRDVLDKEIPFELEFVQERDGNRVLLDIDFMPPPKTGCCADCSCSVCEFYAKGYTENLFKTTYGYVPGTVHVFKNEIPSTEFEETDPVRGHVTVWSHNDEATVICYVYLTC